MASVIGAPADLLPTYGRSRDMAYPHIDEYGGIFAWVVVERGKEWERRETRDVGELLYWIFQSITFSMASDWELKHRIEGQDSRKLLFAKTLDLLGALSPDWPARQIHEWGYLVRDVGLDVGAWTRDDAGS